MGKKLKDPRDQFARFVETARKLECDDDKERFEERLGKVAKAKPKPKEPPQRES